jgi:hypothetical protein
MTSLRTRTVCRGAGLATVLGLALVGCGREELQRSFGLIRDAPDEFVVTTRAPLSIPPDFSLRPPDPGAPRPQEQTSTQAAEAALVPQAALAPEDAQSSPGQQALLSAAGPAAPADIRLRVDQDAAREASDHSLTDRLMFWKSPRPPGTVVDAQKEAQRLRDNAALGQSPVQGDTPTIKNKPKTFFDTLF